jgi:hypothetical protein
MVVLSDRTQSLFLTRGRSQRASSFDATKADASPLESPIHRRLLVCSCPIHQGRGFEARFRKDGRSQGTGRASGATGSLEENAGGFVGEATRTCKVPAGKPIFFPVFNFICSPATNDTGDLQECATSLTDETLPASNYFAMVDGESVTVERVASGPFTITLPKDNVLGAPPGAYPAATDGLWVYLPEGLTKGEHVITFGGTFPTPFGTLTLDITYNMIVK